MQHLKNFVPNAIIPYIEVNNETYSGETRKLTVMFASLGVDLSSAKTPEGMERIQIIVTNIQKIVYRMEGSLNKLVMDDKGSTLICVWGLPPLAHEDDATRAVLAGLMIRDKLNSEEIKCSCSIGIATGIVFSGVVGTSGSRKEFSVLGDVVNIAARIMGHSKSIKNKIFVGMQTAKDAAPFIKFNYIQHCEFKGKTINLPIYEPIPPDTEKAVTLRQQLFPYASLKLHANPFIIDRNNKFQETFCKMYGRKEQLDNAINDIVEFCTDLTYSLLISVNGQSGCGKTLFARALINRLREVEPSNPQFDWANKEKIVTLVSSVNASTEKLFLNSWVSVLRDMLELLKIRRNLKKEVILANLYRENEDILSRLFILENIFGLELQKDHEQIPVKQSKIAFVEREKYDDDTTEHIVDFLSDFIMKEVLEENPDLYPGVADHHLEVPPVLIFFDNVYMMDKPSWDLLSMLKESCHRIGFILLIKTDPDNRVIFHPEAVETATEFYCEK